MKLKSIKIGDLQTPNNVFFAPMAGYTDGAFRTEIIKLGAGLTFTELVSAKGLVYNGSCNGQLLQTKDYSKTVAQIFGGDAYFMRSACEGKELEPFKVIDINMGCPVPKVYKNGEGSALLKDILKAENIIKECVKSGKTITVKIRTGLVKGDNVATEFSKMAENAGAKLITIHGRVRESYYSGEVDFFAIENAKKSVSIPVIANGGIFSVEDANNLMDKTGADGVMVARGGIYNPFLIAELTNTKVNYGLKEFILNQINGMREIYPERKATVEFRKFVASYLKGKKYSKELKLKFMSTETTQEIIDMVEKYL